MTYDIYDCYIKSVVHNCLIPYKYNFTFDKINIYSKSLSTKEVIWEYENKKNISVQDSRSLPGNSYDVNSLYTFQNNFLKIFECQLNCPIPGDAAFNLWEV